MGWVQWQAGPRRDGGVVGALEAEALGYGSQDDVELDRSEVDAYAEPLAAAEGEIGKLGQPGGEPILPPAGVKRPGSGNQRGSRWVSQGQPMSSRPGWMS